VAVECIGQTEVVKHRRHVEEFRVEDDAVLRAVLRCPFIGPEAVVE
jgi:hypothetical protein